MNRILLIAKRDYLAAVQTKAFLIGLLVAPLLFGGSFFATALLRKQPGNEVRRVAVIDRTGAAATAVIEQIRQDTSRSRLNGQADMQMASYEFETVTPNEKSPDDQRLALSDRVRRKDLFAFLEISGSSVQWYSNEGGLGETAGRLAGPVNDGLRRIRLQKLGLDGKQMDMALRPVPVERMNLVAKDEKTGRIAPARKLGVMEGFAAPFVMAMLFFIIVLLTSAPMLGAVAEDKVQRVFEMLLVSASPFDLISGKVLAAVGAALTSSIFYVIGAFVLLQTLSILGLAPLRILPWFFVYLVAEVTMVASLATALGAACSSTRDAENLKLLVIAPVIIPVMMLTPILQAPNGTFATLMSFFPLFTPTLMLVRQAAPGGVPAWQPWLGLVGVAVATLVIAWMASRIFRIAILMQGKTPNLPELLRWGLTE